MVKTLINTFFIDIVGVIALLCYVICIIPQIIENYRLKSTKGWDDRLMLFYFFGCISLLYYIFCLNLSIFYKVITPLEAIALGTIVAQRFYYEPLSTKKGKAFLSYFCMFSLLTLITSPFTLTYPYEVGHWCGWASFILFTMDTIPQIVKIFREKSVEGFSIGFLHIFTIASSTELALGLFTKLPLPTIFIALKNVISCVIFYVQFWLYQKKG